MLKAFYIKQFGELRSKIVPLSFKVKFREDLDSWDKIVYYTDLKAILDATEMILHKTRTKISPMMVLYRTRGEQVFPYREGHELTLLLN